MSVGMGSSVEVTWLVDHLLAGSECLLVDVRPAHKFVEGHVDGAINLTCSNLMMRRLKKGNLSLSVLVHGEDAKATFEEKKKRRYVVLYDHDNATSEMLVLITKRLEREGSSQVKILEGGFNKFSCTYPHLCSKLAGGNCCSSPSRLSLAPLTLSSLTISSPSDDVERQKHHDGSEPVQIRPHLFLGSERNSSDCCSLERCGITHILNVTANVENKFEDRFHYKRIPIHDNWTQDISSHFEDAIAFIENARKKNGRVLIHCVAGISRSVTVTIAYIMQETDYSLNDAFDFVKQRKSDISPNFGFMGQLLEFQKKLKQKKLTEDLPSVNSGVAYQRYPSCVELCAH